MNMCLYEWIGEIKIHLKIRIGELDLFLLWNMNLWFNLKSYYMDTILQAVQCPKSWPSSMRAVGMQYLAEIGYSVLHESQLRVLHFCFVYLWDQSNRVNYSPEKSLQLILPIFLFPYYLHAAFRGLGSGLIHLFKEHILQIFLTVWSTVCPLYYF